MCGISGYIGNKVNIEKMKILGILNDTRGKHSCGIYYGNQVVWGVDKQARLPELLANHIIEDAIVDINPTLMLMHSRSATMGAHTKGNAHPITISKRDSGLIANSPEGPYDMVGVHNGKIDNFYNMREKFIKQLPFAQFDIDSKILMGRLFLNQEHPEEVLLEYEGAASIMYTYDNESLFVFRGEADGDEERPLVYLQEPEGWYFSSLPEPLEIIKTSKDGGPFILEGNALFKFTVTKQGVQCVKVCEVPRKKPVRAPVTRNPVNHGHGNWPDYNKGTRTMTVNNSENQEAIEKMDKNWPNAVHGDVVFQNLRYKNKDVLLNGKVNITDLGYIGTMGKEYWFYEGILVSKEGYFEIIHKMLDSLDDVFITMSHIARYPIFCSKVEDIFRNREVYEHVTYKGKVFTGTILPLFCNTFYSVKDGKIKAKETRNFTKNKSRILEDQVWVEGKNRKMKNALKDYHTGKDNSDPEDRKASEKLMNAKVGDPIINPMGPLLPPVEPEGALIKNLTHSFAGGRHATQEELDSFEAIQDSIIESRRREDPGGSIFQDIIRDKEVRNQIPFLGADTAEDQEYARWPGLDDDEPEEPLELAELDDEIIDSFGDHSFMEDMSEHRLSNLAKDEFEELVGTMDDIVKSYEDLERPLPEKVKRYVEAIRRAKDTLIVDEQ